MPVIRPATPGGNVIFCDDIRFEANGKTIFIGVYTGEIIILGSAPATLPSFAVMINYLERPGDLDGPVLAKLLGPGDEELACLSIPVDQARLNFNPEFKEEDNLILLQMNVTLHNVLIKQEGFIRLRIFCGDTEIRMGSLRVRFQGSEGVVAI